MKIIDLDRRRGRLIRLVHALQHERDQTVASADQEGGLMNLANWYPTDLRDPLRGARQHSLLQLIEADGVSCDVGAIDPAIGDDLPEQRVEQRDVRSRPNRQVEIGFARGAASGGDQ